jgi:hypothetical protein
MPIPTDRANKNAQWVEPFRMLKSIHVEEDRPVQLALTPTPELLSAGKFGTQSLAASMEFAMQGLVKLIRSGALPLESAGLLVSPFLDWQIPSLEVVAKQGGVITFLCQNDNETQTKNYKICPFTVQFNNVESQKIGGGTIAIAIPKTTIASITIICFIFSPF